VQGHHGYACGAGRLLGVTELCHTVIYIPYLGWLVKLFVSAT
jgi:hypothetical protein